MERAKCNDLSDICKYIISEYFNSLLVFLSILTLNVSVIDSEKGTTVKAIIHHGLNSVESK